MTIKPKGYIADEETGEPIPVLTMNAEEALERLDLNHANTASALRRRVVAELATTNGHSSPDRQRLISD